MAEQTTDLRTIQSEVATSIAKKDISDAIINSFELLVERNSLKFPEGYNVGNNAKLAYLRLIQTQDLALCDKASVGQAITEMLLQGLEPDKNQFYFIKYGNKIKLFRSYFGDVAVALRSGLVKDIKAMCIYEGDNFEVGIKCDEEYVKTHETKFTNRDNPIIGAYAVAILPDGKKRYCILTKNEIEKSWAKSTNKMNSTQKEFPQEMAKRTAIRRLVKMLFNTANTADNYLSQQVIQSYTRTTQEEYEQEQQVETNKPKTTVNNSLVNEEIIDSETGEFIENNEELQENSQK